MKSCLCGFFFGFDVRLKGAFEDSFEGVVTMVEGTMRPEGLVTIDLLVARPTQSWDLVAETTINCTLSATPGAGAGGASAFWHDHGPK